MTEEKNFASAVMMRLVAAGLQKQGFNMAQPKLKGAHVSLPQKRDVLTRLWEEHGTLAVLRLSDAVPDMPDEPVVLALRQATSVSDLLERWRRVEIFSHGSHRVLSKEFRPECFQLQHVGRSASAQPSLPESLLVLGVITRLSELACEQPLTVKLPEGQVIRRNSVWQTVDIRGWDQTLSITQTTSKSLQIPPKTDRTELVAVCKDLLLKDPVKRWSVQDLASETGVSRRTLQRRFAEQDETFSGLVSKTRLEKAALYLCESDGPGLAETGFLAGYTDQAHFSRSFTQNVGTTPTEYKQNFAR